MVISAYYYYYYYYCHYTENCFSLLAVIGVFVTEMLTNASYRYKDILWNLHLSLCWQTCYMYSLIIIMLSCTLRNSTYVHT